MMKVGRPDEFNDPFDCAVGIPEEFKDYPDDVERAKRGFKLSLSESIGVLCFSEVPDSPPMSAHYAQKHQGILSREYRSGLNVSY